MLSGSRAMDLRKREIRVFVVGGAKKFLEATSGNFGDNSKIGMLLGWSMAVIYMGGTRPRTGSFGFNRLFGCTYEKTMFRDVLSLSLGVISVISWSVAEIPQIMTNYKKKSIEGVSIAFLTTWMLGDIFNLVGCLLEPATLPIQFYTAVLYTLATAVLYVQSIYYGHIYPRLKKRRNHQMLNEPLLPEESMQPSTKSILCVVSVFLFLGTFNLLSGSRDIDLRERDRVFVVVGGTRKLLQVTISGESSNIGMLLGWAMAAIYMGGRLPQICLNIRRGHVEGLNPLMFCFALLGNVTYVASILVNSIEWSKIEPNLPWLVDAGGCAVLDFFILFQFFYFFRCPKVDKDYKKKKHETGEEAV